MSDSDWLINGRLSSSHPKIPLLPSPPEHCRAQGRWHACRWIRFTLSSLGQGQWLPWGTAPGVPPWGASHWMPRGWRCWVAAAWRQSLDEACPSLWFLGRCTPHLPAFTLSYMCPLRSFCLFDLKVVESTGPALCEVLLTPPGVAPVGVLLPSGWRLCSEEGGPLTRQRCPLLSGPGGASVTLSRGSLQSRRAVS